MDAQRIFATEEYLTDMRGRARDLERRVKDARSEKIASYDGDTNAWHDNFAYEEAARQESVARAELLAAIDVIKNIAIVPRPESAPDCAGIWTRVFYESDDGTMREIGIAPFGGEDIKNNIYNYRAPIAAQILGARPGESKIISIPLGEFAVKIVRVERL